MPRRAENSDSEKDSRNGEMEISTIEKVTREKKVSRKACTMNCFKLLLAIFNIIFILVGIALLAVGIWTAVSKLYVSNVIGDTLFSAASYLLIAVGFVVICISIVGLLAVLKENKRWLKIYFGLLIFGFLILIVAAILAIVFKGEVESVMVNSMRKSLIESYGSDKVITDSWDKLQTELECCAISRKSLGPYVLFNFPYKDGLNPKNDNEIESQDSWPIYKRTEFYGRQLKIGDGDRKYVPPSCCVVDKKTKDYKSLKHCQFFSTGPPSNFESTFTNDYLLYQGCYDKAKELVLGQSDIIVALGFVFAFLMVAGMVVTFFLLRSLNDEAEDEVKRRREPDNL
ncbi:CD151 antigen [Biomphalaria glabrata]|nr:CD151 antigen-like [Biomphalaria glabrata]KAI8781097.1 CD151 antigen [Biomphalaria glabrata]